MRSDDGGDNWEYYSTLAYDPANIIDYEEPGLVRLKDGRLVCFMRTHVNPSSDAKNMVMVVSEDDGFTWTPPKWTNIWGYPPELIALNDGRYLMIYGYRRPPYGVRGIVSEDGVTWDVKNEFVIREGGVPGKAAPRPRLEPHVAGIRQDTAAEASTGTIPASTSISVIQAWRKCRTARSWCRITNGATIRSPCNMSAARGSGCLMDE